MSSALPESVFGWPQRGVGAPLQRKMFEDEGGSRKMTGGADDLGILPAMFAHNLLTVEDILNGVLSMTLFDDCTGGDTL